MIVVLLLRYSVCLVCLLACTIAGVFCEGGDCFNACSSVLDICWSVYGLLAGVPVYCLVWLLVCLFVCLLACLFVCLLHCLVAC